MYLLGWIRNIELKFSANKGRSIQFIHVINLVQKRKNCGEIQ